MIRIPAGIIESVLCHELHDLQRALLAADVRELHVRLKGSHLPGRPRGMHEQAIGKHRNLRRLERAVEQSSVGALSGAVGTYATNGPEFAAFMKGVRAAGIANVSEGQTFDQWEPAYLAQFAKKP